MSEYEHCISDAECNAVYHRSIARTNRRNPQRYDCPDCGRKGALSAHERNSGYHCSACTRASEINPLADIRLVSRSGIRTEFKIIREPVSPSWRVAWIKRGCLEPWCSLAFYGEIKAGSCLASYGGELWPTAWPDLFQTPKEYTCNDVGVIFITEECARLLNHCPGCAGDVSGHSEFCLANPILSPVAR